MATTLKQIQSQKQKLAPRQVLQARLLQLNTLNLEQAIIAELEKNDRLIEINEFEVVNGYERVTSSSNMDKLPDQLIKLELATISLNKTKS